MSPIARYRGPLLHSHGTADRTILFSLGEKLSWVANVPKVFVKIPGAGYNDWLTEEYPAQLDALIGQFASERRQPAK